LALAYWSELLSQSNALWRYRIATVTGEVVLQSQHMKALRSRRWQTITLGGLGLQATESIYYHPEKGASHAEVFMVYCDRRYFSRWMCCDARFTVAWKQRTRQIT
jgi:hypothetical protein